jgi:hypothetical protein
MLSVLVAACGDPGEASVVPQREAVVGGEISGAEDDAVVRVVSRRPMPYGSVSCTAVLLAPNLLVTALHCVASFDPVGRFECRANGSLDPTLGGGWIGETVDPELLDVYFGTSLAPVVAAHGAHVLGAGSTAICLDDIAFVVLDTALPSPGRPVRISQRVQTGEEMTVIGYGQNEFPDTPRARRSRIPVLDVGPDDTSDGLGTSAPRTFVLGDGPCPGDSGGPALSDDTLTVTGVLAYFVSSDCQLPGTRGVFTELAPFRSLLESAFELAGAEPRTDAMPPEAPPATHASGCALRAVPRERASRLSLLGALVVLFASRRATRARSAAGPHAPWRS